MGFLVFTYVGLVVALVHIILPGAHRVGPASAFALGVAGAWGGALLASTLIQGGWTSFGLLALLGSLLGAVGNIAALELAAEAYLRHEET